MCIGLFFFISFLLVLYSAVWFWLQSTYILHRYMACILYMMMQGDIAFFYASQQSGYFVKDTMRRGDWREWECEREEKSFSIHDVIISIHNSHTNNKIHKSITLDCNILYDSHSIWCFCSLAFIYLHFFCSGYVSLARSLYRLNTHFQ